MADDKKGSDRSEKSTQLRSAPKQRSTSETATVKPFDVDDLIQRLLARKGKKPGVPVVMSNKELIQLNEKVCEIFRNQPILLDVDVPISIVGDTHGQFLDLLRIFEHSGYPSDYNYLFLGDYVDRGKQSTEAIALLFAFKVKYPLNFFLLRGNHECAQINRIYGFFDEVKRRYSVKLWKRFCDTFNQMPVAALIGKRIFCMHGGLSPDLTSLKDIRSISRPLDIPDYGLVCDILWSDPNRELDGWAENNRGVSFTFGANIVNDFCDNHGVELILRAHQVVEDGYEFFAKQKMVTIFSAPNYCGEFDNAAAVLKIDEKYLCKFDILYANPKVIPKYEKESEEQELSIEQ